MSSNFTYQSRQWIGSGRSDCIANRCMIASKHPFIGEAGLKMIQKGGNAVDAAVAAAFMDCVVEPAMNGIGGEGVMTIHLSSGENIVIDYVGRPAATCNPDMFQLEEEVESGWMGWWKVKDDANVIGHKACTTPGIVAGLTTALEHYGTLSLSEVLTPAIKVAKEGFVVGWWTASHIFNGMRLFSKFPEWRRIYLQEGRWPYKPFTKALSKPEKLVNKDLGKSLQAISEEGPKVFYEGWIAKKIVEEMGRGEGILTMDDFRRYEPIIHQPEPGNYRGYDVVYDPTHSGTTMLQILKILEGFELKELGFGSPETVHLMTEAIGLAFADRFKYMGDPGWVKVPLKGMVSNEYAAELRNKISLDKAEAIIPGNPWPYESENTTALAVGDYEGNFVAVNQTLVNSFGCGVVIPGTGIVMNNAMYGLDPKPNSANSIDGRKRRIQNVCPTVLLFQGEPFMSIGAPGGRAIQISVSQVISNVIDHGMGIQEAIEAPRVTRETDTVYVDNRFPLEVKIGLEKRGHDLVWVDQEIQNWARPVGVLRDPKTRLLHGGVQCNFTAFESIAMGI